MEGVVPEGSSRDDVQQNDEHTLDLQQDSGAQDSSHPTPHDSPQLSPALVDGEASSKPPAPLQKRRRVTRACDGALRFLALIYLHILIVRRVSQKKDQMRRQAALYALHSIRLRMYLRSTFQSTSQHRASIHRSSREAIGESECDSEDCASWR